MRFGKIITFYSYKGGTGRTMSLANIATYFAQRGNKVLIIDWDMEAPGLHQYFRGYSNSQIFEEQEGLIEFMFHANKNYQEEYASKEAEKYAMVAEATPK
ncbi:MAG: AAA family ATPase, partial [Bacteroidota bacterium]